MKENMNVGAIIREELKAQERSITWFAKKLSCTRTNAYNILSRNNIDLELLVRISKVLHRNFVKEIGEGINNDCTDL
ncbi:MAG: XRE family transcriptional regulator [Prevotellaceae bacterium]|nr:XRE family transcriptional regulator [Prevotellaceae bacterium]